MTFSQLLAMAVTVVFLFGVLVCAPAEHAALETESPSAVQAFASSAASPSIIKIGGDRKAPVKKNINACTGHCAAHGVSLPVSFGLEAAVFAQSAIWSPQQDRLLVAVHPVLLERPPRA